MPKIKLVPKLSNPGSQFKDRDAIWTIQVDGIIEEGDYINHALAVQRYAMLCLKEYDPVAFEEYYSGRLDDNRGEVRSSDPGCDRDSDEFLYRDSW